MSCRNFFPVGAAIVGLAVILPAHAQTPLSSDDGALRSHLALEALDRYMETWNTRDAARWATSLHFPHVRPGPGAFRVFESPKDYQDDTNFERTLATGWRYSRWLSRRVIQVGNDKVHAVGHWKRYGEEGTTQPESLISYIITRQPDGWRIQARFAAGTPNIDAPTKTRNHQAASAAVGEYVYLFNSHDPELLAQGLHYPQVRIADGELHYWDSAAQFLAGPEPGRQRTWAETRIEKSEVVQVADRGANVAVVYSRRSASGEILSQYEAIFLVTERDGKWKVQASSSMGP